MKLSLLLIGCVLSLVLTNAVAGQTKRPVPVRTRTTAKAPEVGQTAIVLDETLSVLREQPSLFSPSIQRMRRGREIKIIDVAEADGVKFYRVAAPPSSFGFVQADAVFGRFRPSDEGRLAELVQASSGFDQIELATEFFKLYPNSLFRPAILMLFGDLVEEAALKLTKDANSRLSKKEMAATGAPLHSYFLNFVSLDRYRKLGIVYLFNPTTRQFHYDGASWKEVIARFPNSNEAGEAKKRIEQLKIKMDPSATAAGASR